MTNINPSMIEKTIAQIDRDHLIKLVMDMVDIPSPTGYEGDCTRAVVLVKALQSF